MDQYNSRRTVNPDTAGLNRFFLKVYEYMAMALLVSFVTAYIGVKFFAPQILSIFSNPIMSLVMFAVMIGFVYLFSKRVYTNPGKAFGMLMGYAVLNGATFAVIGLSFHVATIGMALAGAVALFAGMALYGYMTKKSLASWRGILMGAMIGLIVVGLLNIFFFNSMVYFVTAVIGIIVFSAMTAYDMNTLKSMYYQFSESGAGATMEQGLAVSGALNLYLDFVNIFIYLLQIFGLAGGSNND
ncbi:FtsH-binding integral membrane protein [Weissella uvarum]|uniref:Bax inhibitor-1/YccA family protein n=1 Tax=Weissella uvarum TaxID=1479233 RepID=UPI0019609814|nr:Bax inhibitor-1/YccA family protein [Weissella uvarum]MBM7617508.1 FtsH-binding integral membrane protein [Weissella uvarum]MCM0595608.1 Bax inhibitor-1/YccA family protein [Weissella uvarum]